MAEGVSDVSAPDNTHQCGGECGGVFYCPGCERVVGWCRGAGDDMPELCDDCWNDVTKRREAVGVHTRELC